MIFFSNAEGTINAVVSSPVYQGSNYANEVVFVAPFVPVSVVTVSFIKPNGEYTPAALMTVKELTGIKDEKDISRSRGVHRIQRGIDGAV